MSKDDLIRYMCVNAVLSSTHVIGSIWYVYFVISFVWFVFIYGFCASLLGIFMYTYQAENRLMLFFLWCTSYHIYVHHSIRFFWRHQDMNRFAASLSSKSNALVELLLERSDRFAMNFRPASGLWVRRRYMAFTPVNTSLLRLKFETRTSLLSSSFECAREDCPSVSMNEL